MVWSLLNIRDSSTTSTIAFRKTHLLRTVKGAEGTVPWMINELMGPLINYRMNEEKGYLISNRQCNQKIPTLLGSNGYGWLT